MKRLSKLVAWLSVITLVLPVTAWAASSCFWVPYVISGAVSGSGGVCRLTISAITGSGLVAGDSISVTGVSGATGCNVTTTISTVVDSTHIELTGTTFGGTYTSGGTVAGGHWNASNATNWASASGGTVGTCAATGGVPKNAGDSATWDTNSGSNGTIVPDTAVSSFNSVFNSFDMRTFTGTIDFSVNNPNFSFGVFNAGGASGNATLKLGSGTFTCTGASSGTPWNLSGTNLVLNAGTSTIILCTSSSMNTRGFNFGNGLTYNTVTIEDGTSGGEGLLQQGIGGTATITTLNINGPIWVGFNQTLNTLTITNPVNWNSAGSANSIVNLTSSANNGVIPIVTLSSAGGTCNWCVIGNLTIHTNNLTATNSFDAKGNTGVTITGPSGGSGGHIIGGW